MKPLALFLTHSPPRPSISGDRIRTFHLMRELRDRGWHVSLFSLLPADEPVGLDAALAEAADEWLLVPRRVSGLRRLVSLGGGLLRRRAFHRDWFWSRRGAAQCRDWIDGSRAGVLFVEQLFMYPYVPSSRRGGVVLDTQNFEVARLRAMAAADSSAARRAMARLQLGPVERYERAAVARVARVLAVSPEEEAAFEQIAAGRVRLVPNGVDVRSIESTAITPSSRNLLYLGSMSYAPNADAVMHFVDEIAPLVRTAGVALDVIGSSPSRLVHLAAARAKIPTTVWGFVSDVRAFYRGRRAMIVPLRQGGGTRLKILEALGHGLPVITTTIGCAGLGLTNEREALIADSPAQFAGAIDRLMEDDALWERLSAAGRSFVEQQYDWHEIGATLDGVMREVVPMP